MSLQAKQDFDAQLEQVQELMAVEGSVGEVYVLLQKDGRLMMMNLSKVTDDLKNNVMLLVYDGGNTFAEQNWKMVFHPEQRWCYSVSEGYLGDDGQMCGVPDPDPDFGKHLAEAADSVTQEGAQGAIYALMRTERRGPLYSQLRLHDLRDDPLVVNDSSGRLEMLLFQSHDYGRQWIFHPNQRQVFVSGEKPAQLLHMTPGRGRTLQ